MSAEGEWDEAVGLESLLHSRAYLYTLFHKLFGATPNTEVLDALLGNDAADAVGAYVDDDVTMQGLHRFLYESASRGDQAQLLEQVRCEYTRLFIGTGALPAPAWESPYRTNEHTLFQENTLAVRAVYRAHGLEPKRMQRVPDDHVALMCSFMAVRAGAVLDDLRTGDSTAFAAELRDQLSFVNGHLKSWLGMFAKEARASKTAVLYPQLLEAAAAFVTVDAVFLAEAAYWAESLAEASTDAQGIGVQPSIAEAKTFEGKREALAALEVLRPFGIEDYELVPVERDGLRNLS